MSISPTLLHLKYAEKLFNLTELTSLFIAIPGEHEPVITCVKTNTILQESLLDLVLVFQNARKSLKNVK